MTCVQGMQTHIQHWHRLKLLQQPKQNQHCALCSPSVQACTPLGCIRGHAHSLAQGPLPAGLKPYWLSPGLGSPSSLCIVGAERTRSQDDPRGGHLCCDGGAGTFQPCCQLWCPYNHIKSNLKPHILLMFFIDNTRPCVQMQVPYLATSPPLPQLPNLPGADPVALHLALSPNIQPHSTKAPGGWE